MWKKITHNKGLSFERADVANFFKAVSNAGSKKGCLLIQFPPGTGNKNRSQLLRLLNCISESDPQRQWKIAIEFRIRSWYNEEVYHLLNFFHATLVIHDIPASATPMINSDVDFVYVRFHGPTGNYRDSYSDSFLSEYAGYIIDWLAEGKTVYMYFNNTMGDAFKNLEMLNGFIQC